MPHIVDIVVICMYIKQPVIYQTAMLCLPTVFSYIYLVFMYLHTTEPQDTAAESIPDTPNGPR